MGTQQNLKFLFGLIFLFAVTVSFQNCGRFRAISETDLSSELASSGSGSNASDPAGTGSALANVDVNYFPPIGQCVPARRGAQKEGVRRLNGLEFQSSLESFRRSILGVNDGMVPNLGTLYATFPDPTYIEDVALHDPNYSSAQDEHMIRIIDYVANAVVTNKTYISIDSCLGESNIAQTCWQNVFARLGRVIYRRPLASDELDSLVQLTMTKTSSADAIYAAIFLLLRSPAFLFHFEIGVDTPNDPLRVRLTDYEVANRIAYAITGAPPDDVLATAADNGQLKTLAQVRAQIERLELGDVANPRDLENKPFTQRIKLDKFFREWLKLNQVQTPNNDVFYWVQKLGAAGGQELAYAREVEDYLFYTFWRSQGNFHDLMTAKIGFPRSTYQLIDVKDPSQTIRPDSVVSFIYGGNYQDRFSGNWTSSDFNTEAKPFPAPNNPGLITRAAFMATSLSATQPIQRSAFVLRRILCEPLPEPDFSVISQRNAEIGNLDPMLLSNHDSTSTRTAGTSCMSCHSKINPVGFALESFDMLGQRQSVEKVYKVEDPAILFGDKQGVATTHPLLTPVPGVVVGDGKSAQVSSPEDLVELLSSSNQAHTCMARFALRHFERRLEAADDSCALNEAAQSLSKGEPVRNLFVNVLGSEDIFWRRK